MGIYRQKNDFNISESLLCFPMKCSRKQLRKIKAPDDTVKIIELDINNRYFDATHVDVIDRYNEVRKKLYFSGFKKFELD